ncbi:hypothetical protein ACTXT7_014441 [Hymenolepis weldensis]
MKSLLIFLTVAAAVATAYQIPYYIFMDCYDPICRLNDMYGFHCKNGLCSFVCNAGGCRSDGLPSRSMLSSSNLIFYGCENPVCVMDDFHGYGCNDGVCQFICSDSGCYEGTRVNPQSRKTKRNKKKKFTEKRAKLQKEIESRERGEEEKKAIEKVTTLEMVTKTTTVEPPSTTHKIMIANVETEAPTDETQTTVPTLKENSTTHFPTTIAKLPETSENNSENSKETTESKPEVKKQQPRQPLKRAENEITEVAKKEEKPYKAIIFNEILFNKSHLMSTVAEVCDNERILDIYHFYPYVPQNGLIADSCNLQCWKLSYVCSAMMSTDICMCGDIPTDMIGTSFTCPKSAIDIRCTLAANTTVAIDVGYCESSLVKPYTYYYFSCIVQNIYSN